MGLFGRNVDNPLERMFIELSDAQKSSIVVKWPDQQVRKGARVNVDADYRALFIDRGVVQGVLSPGSHKLEVGPDPLKAWLTDIVTNDRLNDLELFFVRTSERTSLPFGGPVDNVSVDDFMVSLRVFGEVAYRVVDPEKLIRTIAGTSGVADDASIDTWVTNQLLAAVREEVPTMIAAHGILRIGETQDEAEVLVAEKANVTLADYGLQVSRFGQLNVNVDATDLQMLKDFISRKQHVKLAGGYEQFAMGEAMIGSGGAAGGEGGGGGGLNAVLLSQLLSKRNEPQAVAAAAPVAVPDAESWECRGCRQPVTSGSAFCSGCGSAQQCAGCSEPRSAGAFCPACGADSRVVG